MECKMGNAIIILIFIFTPICFASDTQLTLPTNYLKELEAIFQNYKNGTLNAEQLEQNLKICSDNGNPECSNFLCNYYFTKKDYPLAYTTCSNIKEGYFEDEKNFMLGYMLTNGLGVLQNKDKGLQFYIKSVSTGEGVSAWNISVIYKDEMMKLIQAERYTAELDEDTVNGYAWAKVAQALGFENFTDKDGVKRPVSAIIDAYRNILIKINRLNEADNLATEICSQIKNCNQ